MCEELGVSAPQNPEGPGRHAWPCPRGWGEGIILIRLTEVWKELCTAGGTYIWDRYPRVQEMREGD